MRPGDSEGSPIRDKLAAAVRQAEEVHARAADALERANASRERAEADIRRAQARFARAEAAVERAIAGLVRIEAAGQPDADLRELRADEREARADERDRVIPVTSPPDPDAPGASWYSTYRPGCFDTQCERFPSGAAVLHLGSLSHVA